MKNSKNELKINRVGAHNVDMLTLMSIIVSIIFLGLMMLSDACFTPYAVIVVGHVAIQIIKNIKGENTIYVRSRALANTLFFATVIALMITIANYRVWTIYGGKYGITGVMCLFLSVTFGVLIFSGAFVSIFFILDFVYRNSEKMLWETKEYEKKYRPVVVFVILSLSVYFFVFFVCKYPGNLTNDSIRQIQQNIQGIYSNHHPFYHTKIIGLFLKINSNINEAVALYSIVSIIQVVLSFAFAIYAFCEMGLKHCIVYIVCAYFIFTPFHIMYSFTMWKDIWFGTAVLTFVVAIYRELYNVGRWLNALCIIVSGTIICLFRSNGMIAFIMVMALLIILMGYKNRVFYLFVFILVISATLKFPLLSRLNVEQPDTIEALSIPAQQIARTIIEHRDIDLDDSEIINKIIDTDLIEGAYKWYISDPIKELVRIKGNQSLIKENLGEYVTLYIRLGVRYPDSYIKAWVDQTRGYLNSGYSYWVIADMVMQNDIGINRTTKSTEINNYFNKYCDFFEHTPFFDLFECIGFNVWIMLGLLYLCISSKKKKVIILISPCMAIWLTLLVATPVFAEFRYIYSLFCVLPFVAVVSFKREQTN